MGKQHPSFGNGRRCPKPRLSQTAAGLDGGISRGLCSRFRSNGSVSTAWGRNNSTLPSTALTSLKHPSDRRHWNRVPVYSHETTVVFRLKYFWLTKCRRLFMEICFLRRWRSVLRKSMQAESLRAIALVWEFLKFNPGAKKPTRWN